MTEQARTQARLQCRNQKRIQRSVRHYHRRQQHASNIHVQQTAADDLPELSLSAIISRTKLIHDQEKYYQLQADLIEHNWKLAGDS
jgi:hypothetical protein